MYIYYLHVLLKWGNLDLSLPYLTLNMNRGRHLYKDCIQRNGDKDADIENMLYCNEVYGYNDHMPCLLMQHQPPKM